MFTQVKCTGEVEKLLKEHKEKHFSHLKSWAAYFIEMSRQRAEEDNKGGGK